MNSDLIPLILSAGGGAFVLSVLQGWREMRAGVRQGQRETVEDLIRWRDDLDAQLRHAVDDRDYWRDLSARRGHQLWSAGIEPVDPQPAPPSRRVDLNHGGRNHEADSEGDRGRRAGGRYRRGRGAADAGAGDG